MNYILTTEELNNGKILLLNKDIGWTSFDVVKKTKNIIVKKTGNKNLKVGHAGTLDPLATGLMVLCTGKETKNIQKYQNEPKEYVAEFYLGKTTPSFDLETEIDKVYPIGHITKELVEEKLKSFLGITDQVPPLFSAKWINGKRAYEHARQGNEIELEPVNIEIYDIKIVHYEMPVLTLKISCSKGTYIRSLARDIGFALKSGAYLQNLVRTKIGSFKLEDSLKIDDFEKKLIIN